MKDKLKRFLVLAPNVRAYGTWLKLNKVSQNNALYVYSPLQLMGLKPGDWQLVELEGFMSEIMPLRLKMSLSLEGFCNKLPLAYPCIS